VGRVWKAPADLAGLVARRDPTLPFRCERRAGAVEVDADVVGWFAERAGLSPVKLREEFLGDEGPRIDLASWRLRVARADAT